MEIKSNCNYCENALTLTGDFCWDKPDIKVGVCENCGLKQLLSFFHVGLDYYSEDEHFPEDLSPLRKREYDWNQKRMEN